VVSWSPPNGTDLQQTRPGSFYVAVIPGTAGKKLLVDEVSETGTFDTNPCNNEGAWSKSKCFGTSPEPPVDRPVDTGVHQHFSEGQATPLFVPGTNTCLDGTFRLATNPSCSLVIPVLVANGYKLYTPDLTSCLGETAAKNALLWVTCAAAPTWSDADPVLESRYPNLTKDFPLYLTDTLANPGLTARCMTRSSSIVGSIVALAPCGRVTESIQLWTDPFFGRITRNTTGRPTDIRVSRNPGPTGTGTDAEGDLNYIYGAAVIDNIMFTCLQTDRDAIVSIPLSGSATSFPITYRNAFYEQPVAATYELRPDGVVNPPSQSCDPFPVKKPGGGYRVFYTYLGCFEGKKLCTNTVHWVDTNGAGEFTTDYRLRPTYGSLNIQVPAGHRACDFNATGSFNNAQDWYGCGQPSAFKTTDGSYWLAFTKTTGRTNSIGTNQDPEMIVNRLSSDLSTVIGAIQIVPTSDLNYRGIASDFFYADVDASPTRKLYSLTSGCASVGGSGSIWSRIYDVSVGTLPAVTRITVGEDTADPPGRFRKSISECFEQVGVERNSSGDAIVLVAGGIRSVTIWRSRALAGSTVGTHLIPQTYNLDSLN
jgi:hypothetical protein